MNALVEKKAPLVAGASVAALVPTSVEEVFRLAQAVSASGLAPRDMNSPEKLTIAIMTGLEVGLPPMQAIQSIAVINGRPTIWGDGLMAVVRRSALCLWIKEWSEGAGDDMAAFCQTLRSGEPEPVTRSFSTKDAKSAGLHGKSGPWSQYKPRMLQMRARALCLRDVYADLLRGVQVREEVEDYPPREPRDVTPAVSPAMARLAAVRAPQTADTGRQIIEHTEREIAATQGATAHEDDFNNDITDIEPAGTAGYNDGEPEAGGEADGNGAEGSRLAPEQLDVLERLSAALFRATSKAGLKSYAGHFWGENGGAPEKGSPMHDAAGRIWRQHEVRVTGAVDAEGCRAAVDQIIGEVA